MCQVLIEVLENSFNTWTLISSRATGSFNLVLQPLETAEGEKSD